MVGAGFGWSVGDIAQAVKIIVHVTKAFKATGGAASKYENASGFLQSLKATLDHLTRYVNSNDADTYTQDISEQLERMALPWNDFEAFILKFETSLGSSCRQSKLGKAPRTVQYTLKDVSGEVDRLKAAVAQPLHVINTLLSLQQIADIKLVPQKLLTHAQCNQLVEAMSVAGVPKALSDRLESMRFSQEASVLRIQSELEAHIEKICDLQKSLRDRQEERNLQTLAELRVDVDCMRKTATVDNKDSGYSESSTSMQSFRLLVEDQHWSVIQLLRALYQQLDELKRTRHNSPVVLSDHPCSYRGQQCSQSSINVTKTAMMLVSTMTTGIVTGVIVGKISAASTLAHASPPATASRILSSAQSNYATTGSHALVNSSSEPGQRTFATQKRDTAVRDIATTSRDDHRGCQSTERIKLPESPRDSVMESDHSSISSVATQFVGTRHEQTVVKVTISSASANSVSTVRSTTRALTQSAKATAFHSVPECRTVEKDLQAPFFVQGRVFMTIWTAANIEACERSEQLAEVAYIGADANENLSLAEMRRFVVLRNEGPYSICVPIYLGPSLGKAKNANRGPYEIPMSMTSSYTSNGQNVDDDVEFKVAPTTANGMASVPNKSYAKLREVYMIDHDVKIADIGVITEDDLPLLDVLWRDANAGQLSSWLIEDGVAY